MNHAFHLGEGDREQSKCSSVLIIMSLQAGTVGLGHWWGVGFSLLYSVGVVVCEPFWRVKGIDEIVVAALVQVPLLLAIGYLVRGRAWASVAGVALLVFTSNVMIASNANSSSTGSGFFSSWIS